MYIYAGKVICMPVSKVPWRTVSFSLLERDWEILRQMAENSGKTVPGYARSLINDHVWKERVAREQKKLPE